MSNSIQLELTHSVTVVQHTIWVQKIIIQCSKIQDLRNKLGIRTTQLLGPVLW